MCPDGLAQAGLWQPQPAGSLVYTAGFLNAAVPMGMCACGVCACACESVHVNVCTGV